MSQVVGSEVERAFNVLTQSRVLKRHSVNFETEPVFVLELRVVKNTPFFTPQKVTKTVDPAEQLLKTPLN